MKSMVTMHMFEGVNKMNMKGVVIFCELSWELLGNEHPFILFIESLKCPSRAITPGHWYIMIE